MPSHSPPTWDPIRFSQAEFRLVPLKDFSAAMAQLLFREMFASIFYTLSEFDQKSVMVTIESAIGNWAFVPLVANDY
jgi:hypothetical protein